MIPDLLEGRAQARTPVWFMRQAGRFLPSYRKLREKHSFLELCDTPELAARVTMLPLAELDLDAAIIFSDILIPAQRMGLKLSYTDKGPLLEPPVRALQDLRALHVPVPEEYPATAGAVRAALSQLPPGKDLIGFSAAPYTLLTYIADGMKAGADSPSAGLPEKAPELFEALLGMLEDVIRNYSLAQVRAGARVFQLFDTWAGNLDTQVYAASVAPRIGRIAEALSAEGAKVIYFAKDAWHLMDSVRGLPGVAAVSAGAARTLTDYDEKLGGRFALQGNLDPRVLLGPQKLIAAEVDRIMKEGRALKGHIFNLGHGILPETPVENVRFAADRAHMGGLR